MEERAELVFSQTLSNASLEEITLGQDVLSSKRHLFPENFEKEKRADLKLLNDDVNKEILSVVTASIPSEKAPQLVLLHKGWKPVVEKLNLKEGDTVSIFLLDRDTSTYSIQVERAAEEVIIAAKVLISMGTPGLQLLADCALEQQDEQTAGRPLFDVNEPQNRRA